MQHEQQHPDMTYEADDGTVVHGAEAIAQMIASIDETREHNEQALAQLTEDERDGFKHWLETREQDAPPPAPPVPVRQVRPVAGRAPRQAANARRRGSRRSTQRSSSSSDDPDGEPPSCACGCGRPRAAGQYYSSDECRRAHARERKRRQRARDRQNPERVAERGYKLAIKRAVAQGTSPHILCGLEHPTFALHSPDDDVFCGVCGRWLAQPSERVNGFDKTAREMQRLDKLATGERRHEPWALRRERSAPPWPDRTYFDPTIVRTRSRGR
jgi:hypothetical protein